MASRVSIWTLCVVGFLVIQMDPVFSCDTDALEKCVKNSFGDDGLPDLSGVSAIGSLRSFCRVFQGLKQCTDTTIADCSDSSDDIQQVRLALSIMKYMCEDQYQAISSHASCWNNVQVQNGMKHCGKSTIVNDDGVTPDCSGMQKANECIGNTVREHCDEEAASVITNVLQHTESLLISPQTCDFNSVKAFRPQLTSLVLGLVVAVLAPFGNRIGQLLL